MPGSISLHPLATKEFRKARNWYARRSPDTAIRFVSAFDAAVQQIATGPRKWPLYDDTSRWVRLKEFPYLLLYRVNDDGDVRIVAVAHAKQRRGYWRRRKN